MKRATHMFKTNTRGIRCRNNWYRINIGGMTRDILLCPVQKRCSDMIACKLVENKRFSIELELRWKPFVNEIQMYWYQIRIDGVKIC